MDEVSIEKARARLGDYVNDAQNGTPVLITRSGKPAAVLVPVGAATRLDGTDRRMIAKAREVAALKTAEVMRERYGEADSEMARAAALGEAQFLLLELAAIIARPGGQAAAQVTEENHG